MRRPTSIAPAKGKLGVLTPGMGAVSTTFMAGVELVRSKQSMPVGSLTQLGAIRLGKRTEGRSPLIKDFVPLAGLDDLVFGGWDVFPDTAYEAAKNAGVLSPEHLAKVKKFLTGISAAIWMESTLRKRRTNTTWRCRLRKTSRSSRRRQKWIEWW